MWYKNGGMVLEDTAQSVRENNRKTIGNLEVSKVRAVMGKAD